MSTLSRILTYFTVVVLSAGTVSFFYTSPTYARQQQNVPGGTSSASLNWSGYTTVGSGTYTSVTGSWVVPSINVPTSDTADATWVGIGGSDSQDLIQAGTQAIVSHSGSINYKAWYEMLPGYSIPVSLIISPGDSITATITEQSASNWLITITDSTTGKSYQNTVMYQSSHSSADWVEEMVSNGNGTFRPLDNFGSVTFTSAHATRNGQNLGLSQLDISPLSMVDTQGQVLASASGLNDDGFTVTRSGSSSLAVSTVPQHHYVIFTYTNDGISTSHKSSSSTPTFVVRRHRFHVDLFDDDSSSSAVSALSSIVGVPVSFTFRFR